MTKPTYSVDTPHGIFTRTTKRAYTHVVTALATNPTSKNNGLGVVVGWCGSLDLASKVARTADAALTGWKGSTEPRHRVYGEILITPTTWGG